MHKVENPIVSIIIPTLNRAKIISATLDSILSQTFHEWECIIVDDGSNDNTEEIIKLYKSKDNRFEYFKRPSNFNPGGNGARNYGFLMSKGKYINWFDSDDIMYKDFLLLKVKRFISNQNLNVVACGFIKKNLDTNYTSLPYNINLEHKPLEEYSTENLKLNTPTFMYEREFVSNFKFDEALTRAQDLDFVFKVISNRNIKIGYENTILFEVIVHNNSITGNFRSKKIKQNLNSELQVRKNVMCFFLAEKKYESYYVKLSYGKVLKKILDFREYNIYFNHIIQLEFVSFFLRIKLILIGMFHFATKKGSTLLVNEFKK